MSILAGLNLLVFFASYLAFGGDAITGTQIAGHYFLGHHGRLHETTEAIFTISRYMGLSQLFTVPLALFCGFLSWALEQRGER